MSKPRVYINAEEVEELHIQGPGIEAGKQWKLRIQAVLKKRDDKYPHYRKVVTVSVGEKQVA